MSLHNSARFIIEQFARGKPASVGHPIYHFHKAVNGLSEVDAFCANKLSRSQAPTAKGNSISAHWSWGYLFQRGLFSIFGGDVFSVTTMQTHATKLGFLSLESWNLQSVYNPQKARA